ARNEPVDAARLGHVRDLERSCDQRPVAEHPAEQALLDLHRADALEAHRRDPAAKRAANEREPVVRDDHVRSLPLPRGTERERRPLTPVCRAYNRGEDSTVGQVARKAAVATLVVVGIVALVLALWKLRVLVSLFFLGLVIAAAMRPGIEWLQARRVPRSVGLA